MNSISKLDGLFKIDSHGLPRPDWLFVTCDDELPSKPWAVAPHGWTVRSCPSGEYTFALPAKHMLRFTEVRDRIRTFMTQHPRIDMYVVYPSWQFVYAGTCKIDSIFCCIEAVQGDIAKLLRGTATPDAIARFDIGHPYAADFRGAIPHLVKPIDAVTLMKACRAVNEPGIVILEWTKTTDRGLLFHDWVQFDSSSSV